MKKNIPSAIGKERRLKVYSRYFSRANDWQSILLPEIRLQGRWLQDIGFHQGQTICVLQEENKITITVVQ